MTDERLAQTARGWDEAAEGYEAYYVPRFAPWVAAAVGALAAGPLPDGPVLVPCCGTFPELDALDAHLPGRAVTGVDLSAGMVRLARARAARRPGATVEQGDASALGERWAGRCAAVVSVFGLQQLPAPDVAIRSWASALRPGGVLSVVFWPRRTEDDGPFARIAEVVRWHVPAGDDSWQGRLVPALTAAGTVVERDEPAAYPMSHPDAAAFFDAHTRAGPMRPLVTARGAAFADRLRAQFLRGSPHGEWRHRPHARHLVARRPFPAELGDGTG
ncbi:class I SAM-dependent methyltransferase [Dactylosporangium sp. NPDC050688]|uniref:class I SAM-dependent methyltransferase n=1 Tax=Dactylosporangium sp. NPDC050688 TaxID=3157217 RepID=UPI0033F9A162